MSISANEADGYVVQNIFDINYEKNPYLNSVYKSYIRPKMKHDKQEQQSIEDTRPGLRIVF